MTEQLRHPQAHTKLRHPQALTKLRHPRAHTKLRHPRAHAKLRHQMLPADYSIRQPIDRENNPQTAPRPQSQTPQQLEIAIRMEQLRRLLEIAGTCASLMTNYIALEHRARASCKSIAPEYRARESRQSIAPEHRARASHQSIAPEHRAPPNRLLDPVRQLSEVPGVRLFRGRKRSTERGKTVLCHLNLCLCFVGSFLYFNLQPTNTTHKIYFSLLY